jgi:hypothetical protein
VVGVSALLAGSTGDAVDFYLTAVLLQAGGGVLFLASMLVRILRAHPQTSQRPAAINSR